MYKYHPEIEGLKCNEDGSEILLNGSPLNINISDNGWQYITYRRKKFGITKLVCECWVGVQPYSKARVYRKDDDINNNHYTNLYWAKHGYGRKLSDEDTKAIKQRLLKGESQTDIAKDYQVSNNTIFRINKNLK